MTKQAMILAAGFGTRLLPYTRYRPKPLFPVLNTPLLIAAVQRLKNDGFSKIIVNCHHLREQIVASLADIPDVLIQEEPDILGTGGGLRRALNHLDDSPLLVVNGDIYHDIDVSDLYLDHLRSGHDITMALHDYPRFNKIGVDGEHIVDFDGASKKSTCLAYTGIQVLNPDLLTDIKKDTASCIIEYYRKILAQGRLIHARRCDGRWWTDMGTPDDYLGLHRALLTEQAPRWPELGCDAATVCLDRQAECAEDLEVRDWACIGRAKVGSRVQLCRTVVWDGAVIEPGKEFEDEIVYPEN